MHVIVLLLRQVDNRRRILSDCRVYKEYGACDIMFLKDLEQSLHDVRIIHVKCECNIVLFVSENGLGTGAALFGKRRRRR